MKRNTKILASLFSDKSPFPKITFAKDCPLNCLSRLVLLVTASCETVRVSDAIWCHVDSPQIQC